MNHFKLMLSIISVLFFCACENNTSGEYGQAFSTLTLQTDSTEIHESYSASIKGRQDVDIYPQVSGVITKVCVQEGENVSKGKVLFVIDQVPYQAALRTATANVHAAGAQVETARLDYESKQALLRENVISEYDGKSSVSCP